MRARIIKTDDIEKDEFVSFICEKEKINLSQEKETVDIRNGLIKHMVGYLIRDVCVTSESNLKKLKNIPKFRDKEDVYKEQYIDFSENFKRMHSNLLKLITQLVITSQEVSQSDCKAEYLITKLFRAYYLHPQQLPDHILIRYFMKRGMDFNRLIIQEKISFLRNDPEFIRLICDHIASMTDQYAAREYKKLYEPEYY